MDAEVKLPYVPRMAWDDDGDEDAAYHICTLRLGPLIASSGAWNASRARRTAEHKLMIEVAELAQLLGGG